MLTTGASRLRSALIACIVPISACQAPASSVDPPEPSTIEAVAFSVVGDGPIIDPADFDADYLLPGAAVINEGTIHLFPVAFSAEAQEAPRVLHLTSDDGRTWSGDGSLSLLADFEIELDDIGAVPSSVFVTADGTWVMYGGGRLPGGTDPVVWRATAPDADGPWTAHPDPVLVPEVAGWDSAVTDHPSVVPTEDGYLMAYGGASIETPNRNRIGLASSEDGLSWARMPASLDGADDDLAIGPSACGIDARSMFEPQLFAADAGYRLVVGVMLEGELDAMEILAASSADGTRWTCASDDPVASSDLPGAPSLHSFVAVEVDGAVWLLVEILGEASSTIWLLTADAP
jgi:hypothetical protein